MAAVNFDITAAQVETITDYLGYQTEIEVEGEMVENPETRKVFLYGKIKDYLKNCYKAQMAKEADSHRIEALATAETDLENLDVTE